jgi:putative transposase
VREFTQAAAFLSFGATTSVSSVNAYTKRRRPIHLPSFEQHNRSTIYFVTVSTHGRRPILANEIMHRVLRTAWQQATWFSVGQYMIMPDHVHLFCGPATVPAESLSNWVSYWKSYSANRWFAAGPCALKLWQREFWDRQLRWHQSYTECWSYVRHNPVRAGLVGTAEQWQWQGELDVLRWHQ